MKLSLAIRLGAMLRPQGFPGENGVAGDATCAMMAGCEAAGIEQDYCTYMNQWPWLTHTGVCPECGRIGITFSGIISLCLNDTHRWTRERIADWVESVEPIEPAPVALPPLAVERVEVRT